MSGTRWVTRITESYDLYDGMFYTEAVFHILEHRYGIMDDVFMGWWPIVDPTTTDLIIGQKDHLTGGHHPAMQANWHTVDTLNITPLHPKHPYVESYDKPAPMASITLASQTISKLMPEEMMNIGGSNSLEDFTIPFEIPEMVTINTSTVNNTTPQLGGNGFLWVYNPDEHLNVKAGVIGTVDNSFAVKNKGNANQTWHAQGKSGVGFKVAAADNYSSNIGRGLGYRSWVFSPDAYKRKLTFSMIVNDYFFANMFFSTRIGWANNWQLFDTALTATGQHHLTFKYDPKKVKAANIGKPIVIDWLFDWHYQYANYPMGTDLRMSISCLTVHDGWWDAEDLNPAFNSLQQDRNQGYIYGKSKVKEYCYKSKGEVIFNQPLAVDSYRLALTSTVSMTILEKSRYGFTYQGVVDDGVEWSFEYFTKVAGDLSDIV